ncbi:MAG TPA: hypothetical protein VH143_20140 [Kofleriaceae bacterium]|nr:hypothetical protein [Kofleriaceae bacterium]
MKSARYSGAHTMLLNLEIDHEAVGELDECREGPADELVASVFA